MFRRRSVRLRAALISLAALWGILVDRNVLPFLAPTGSSTIVQATTAAAFALLGILFGPLAGALGGLARDGLSYLVGAALEPEVLARHGPMHWTLHATIDTVEDIVLGWVPGLAAQRTHRLSELTAVTALTTWCSLPFLVVANTLNDGHPTRVWTALTTAAGDWDEPVDPVLTVYALLTAALVGLVLLRGTARPGRAWLIPLGWAVPAMLLMAVGAHT